MESLSCALGAIYTIGSWARKLFGGNKPQRFAKVPPPGCYNAPPGCWGNPAAGRTPGFNPLASEGVLGGGFGGALQFGEGEEWIIVDASQGWPEELLTLCKDPTVACEITRPDAPGIDRTYGFGVFIEMFSANSGNYGVHKVVSAIQNAVRGPTRRAVSDATTRVAKQPTGQMHHGISRTIHKALEQHPNLRGLYTARDSRFVTQAKDLASHRGYDTFHRNLDAEIAGWIRANPNATGNQFESYLQAVYQRPDVLTRFPEGL